MKKFEETVAMQYYKRETRKLTSVVCDECGKEFKPDRGYRVKSAEYIRVHTWHNDWGNDSCESHERMDLCKECAAKFVADYIMNASGSMELELSVEYVDDRETDGTGYIPISNEDVR